MLSSNTVLPEKSLIAVILVAQELNLLYMIVMSVGFGGGGEVGAQNSVPSAALQKQLSLAAIRLHGLLFLSSTNFILPFKLLIGF